MSQDFEHEFAGIGCASIDEFELPTSGGSFFNPAEGVHKVRFLQGPVMSWVSQEWDDNRQPVGDKKRYAYSDPEAKKDSNAKLVMTFLIWNYKEEKVQLWEITAKGIMEAIKSINGIQPDLSAFDVQLTKAKKSNGFMDYKLAQGPNKPFDNKEAIAEVMEKGLAKRLEDANLSNEVDSEEQTSIDEQIESAKAADPAAEELAKAARKQKLADAQAEEDARMKAEAEEAFR